MISLLIYHYYYYYCYYFTPWEFFTLVLAYGFCLESEWQQVSSSLQDSSRDSGRSQQCCSLDILHPSRYFQVLQSLYQSFGDCTKSINYNWYNHHFHSFFNSLGWSRYLSFFSHSFNFTMWSAGTAKSTILQVLSFLLIIIRSGHLAEIRWSVCIPKFQRSLSVLFYRTDSGLCIYHLFVWSNFNFMHLLLLLLLLLPLLHYQLSQ